MAGRFSHKRTAVEFSSARADRVYCEARAVQRHFALTAVGLTQCLVITVIAPPNSFSKITCPTRSGFQTDLMESYCGIATINVYTRKAWQSPTAWQLVATYEIHNVALEFGGSSRCKLRYHVKIQLY